jgi:hypothetical protein
VHPCSHDSLVDSLSVSEEASPAPKKSHIFSKQLLRLKNSSTNKRKRFASYRDSSNFLPLSYK